MGTIMLSSSSSQLMVFHRLLRPAPILSFSLFKQSLSLLPHQTTSLYPITINSSSSCFLRSRTFTKLPVLVSSSQALLESTEEVEDKEIAKQDGEVTAAPSLRVKEKKELPSLSVKEKKELASYAHSLGKKLKSQQVGKSGVTDSVIFALDETLEANELLKGTN